MAKGISFTAELRDYLVAHSIPPSQVHEDLVAATLEAVPDWSIMQIPQEQGSLMTLLTKLTGARLAVEVGTFTGYSALCIAEGLPDDGRLICCDISDEFTSVATPFWARAGVDGRIELRIGPAAETLAAMPLDDPIDLAFVDADKGSYVTYYELLVERMAPGGLIVADNVLQSGGVLDSSNTEANVVAIRKFNDHVAADDRVDVSMVNVADGLSLIRVR